MKILFQGDSITDCGRDRSDPKNIGPGYVKYAAEHICEMFPQKEFEFYNLGIGGNQTKDLVARLETDFIDIQPDLVSILIGINDVWHNANNGGNWLSNDDFECRYRAVLKAIKERTNAKIVMLEPFLFPAEDKQCFRVDLDPKIQVIRKLAREYRMFIFLLTACLQQELLPKIGSFIQLMVFILYSMVLRLLVKCMLMQFMI